MWAWFREQRERRAWVKKQQALEKSRAAQRREMKRIDDFVAGAIAGAILASEKAESQDSNARE